MVCGSVAIFVLLGALGARWLAPHRSDSELRATIGSKTNTCPDLARLNLGCAEALPGSEGLNIEECLQQLDQWTQRVKSETDRHRYRFQNRPEEFDRSEGFFKMLMMAVVLAEDFGVHYKPELKGPAASVADGFFSDSRDVFLHGLLGSKHEGTCSSLPVLYVAVGRRLGYPLKLVTTRGHLFVRWEGSGERFNVEAAGDGVSRFDDEYYRTWPFPITPEEEEAEGYLKSLSPDEESAVFYSIRGMCLQEARKTREAAMAFEQATRLAPNCRSYREMLRKLQAPAGG